MARPISLILVALFLVACRSDETPASAPLELYALDCGSLEVSDMRSFSREGALDGERASLVVPCYLIRHPDGDLLWDLGYPESLADRPDGLAFNEFHQRVDRKLTVQLARLGIQPGDIEYVGLSHSHYDHIGNADLFGAATFILHRAEHAFMFTDERRAGDIAFPQYAALEHADNILFDERHDVFGDGSVVMLSMPGHTPGSAVLQVRLAAAGTLLLTGDLYTHARARELQSIPTFTADVPTTIESRERFEALARREGARVVIQHAKAHFEALPTFPGALN